MRIGAVVLFALKGPVFAQDAAPKQEQQLDRFYRLDFVVKDFQDGKLLDSRNYFVYISDRNKGGRPTSVRADSKVPIMAPSGGSFSNYDVNVGIDCGYRSEGKNNLSLDVSVDVTTLVPPENKSVSGPYPIIRNNRWASDVLVMIRKPTVIFSSDDVSSKRKMEVELTATPVAQ